MKPVRKPGMASFIVVTLLAVLLLWIGSEAPKDVFAGLAVVFLWLVWFSGWHRHRKLAGQIEELSAEVAAMRQDAVGAAVPEAQVAGAPAKAAAVAAAAALSAHASAATPAPVPAGFTQRPAPAFEPAAAAPPPPPPMPPA